MALVNIWAIMPAALDADIDADEKTVSAKERAPTLEAALDELVEKNAVDDVADDSVIDDGEPDMVDGKPVEDGKTKAQRIAARKAARKAERRDKAAALREAVRLEKIAARVQVKIEQQTRRAFERTDPTTRPAFRVGKKAGGDAVLRSVYCEEDGLPALVAEIEKSGARVGGGWFWDGSQHSDYPPADDLLDFMPRRPATDDKGEIIGELDPVLEDVELRYGQQPRAF